MVGEAELAPLSPNWSHRPMPWASCPLLPPDFLISLRKMPLTCKGGSCWLAWIRWPVT